MTLRIKRSSMVILLVASMLVALFTAAAPKAMAVSRTMLDGGGANGLNGDAANGTMAPSIIEFRGAIYAFWTEFTSDANRIRVKKYENSQWSFVDGGTALNINPDKEAMLPHAVVWNDNLYVTWQERGDNGMKKLRVKKYDGTDWTSIDNNPEHGLNYGQFTQAEEPKLVVYKDSLILMWQEFTGMNNRMMAKRYKDGVWESIDGGGTTGLNKDTSKSVFGVNMIVQGDILYATWSEQSGSANQIRVVQYDGSNWTFIDGNGVNGLNKDTSRWGMGSQLVWYNGQLHVLWSEDTYLPHGNRYHVRAMKYDGAVWSFIDGDTTGLSYLVSNDTQGASAVELDGKLYVAWAEGSSTTKRLRLAAFDGTSWKFEDGGDLNKLNYENNRNSVSAYLKVISNELYMTWTEENGTASQVRVSSVSLGNDAPEAKNTNIQGSLRVGNTVEGSYTYADTELDLEGESTYKWYTADDKAGTNKTEIAGAVTSSLKLAPAQLNKYIFFEVTPVAESGTAVGLPTQAVSNRAVSILKGDLNMDGSVTPADVLLLNKHLSGKLTLSAELLVYADMNEDGEIDTQDTSLLLDAYLKREGTTK